MDAFEDSMRARVEEGSLKQTIWDGRTEKGSQQCKHYFGDGVYVRTLLIPAGTAVVGKVHKQARICMILSGRCTFVDSDRRETVEAGWVGEFNAGSKTIVYAHTDTVWAACVATSSRDPVTAFEELTCDTHQEYDRMLEKLL